MTNWLGLNISLQREFPKSKEGTDDLEIFRTISYNEWNFLQKISLIIKTVLTEV